MTLLTEGKHAGECIISLAEGNRSFDQITVLSGETLTACMVVGQVLRAGGTAAAVAGNTGNGTISAIVLGDGNKLGVYKIVFIDPATNLGAFSVEDPDGIVVGTGDVGTEFDAGGLTFTISDGSTDFAAGDGFDITVAAGSNKYVQFDEDATDGSEVAAGILYDDVDASSADATGVIISRDAEVNSGELTWPSSTDAGEKLVAIADLAALGIIVRSNS